MQMGCSFNKVILTLLVVDSIWLLFRKKRLVKLELFNTSNTKCLASTHHRFFREACLNILTSTLPSAYDSSNQYACVIIKNWSVQLYSELKYGTHIVFFGLFYK